VPPLPPRSRLGEFGPAVVPYRRPTGREWPWAQIPADDRFETYEVPVHAPAGRYLWLVLELEGGGQAGPRVREVRVERPGHRLLDRLPRSWSRVDGDASFLQRTLGPAEGLLHELDERAASRDVLLDPTTVPQEALGWLAGLVGLAVDRRWPERARRALVGETFSLYRIRGTQQCLERIVELYLGFRAPVIEHWRLRGLGGALLGTRPGERAAPAVGGAASASGSLGHFTVGGQQPGEDGYTGAAHRFSVLVPARLGPEQRDAVRAIVAAHKPAHTLGDVCELGPMQVGRQLHLDLTAVVGPPGTGWTKATLGGVRVGTDGVVGPPALGARVGQTAVGGAVRVG
jgi:phage tail-like protein